MDQDQVEVAVEDLENLLFVGGRVRLSTRMSRTLHTTRAREVAERFSFRSGISSKRNFFLPKGKSSIRRTSGLVRR